jgi:SAM-dependent methyltransferase
MEKEFVFKTYNIIAKEFDDTRYCKWNSVKLFLDSLSNYSLIADIGCGNGKYMKYNPNNFQYIGIDTCINLLNIIQNKDTILGNALSLPYRNESFDAIISIAVFHHIFHDSDKIIFIKELLRILKINGKIHITVWADNLIKKNMKNLGNSNFLIPWKNKHLRFYHLFNINEIQNILNNFSNINYSINYEMENWCITIIKLN